MEYTLVNHRPLRTGQGREGGRDDEVVLLELFEIPPSVTRPVPLRRIIVSSSSSSSRALSAPSRRAGPLTRFGQLAISHAAIRRYRRALLEALDGQERLRMENRSPATSGIRACPLLASAPSLPPSLPPPRPCAPHRISDAAMPRFTGVRFRISGTSIR
jgi:hypothetical protein